MAGLVRPINVMASNLPFLALALATPIDAIAQNSYSYSVDLTALKNDRLTVELIVPDVIGDSSTFCFPRIVPGIYGAMDHGRLVQDLQAFAEDGRPINVDRIDT